jgi:hypothetical protein
MAGTALVLVHGRSQQMPANARAGGSAEAAFVARKKQSWLAGLAKGMVLADLPAVDPASVYFPYYGNRFADAIAEREHAGGVRPQLEPHGGDAGSPLESMPGAGAGSVAAAAPASAEALILDAATMLGYTPAREAVGQTPEETAEAEEAWQRVQEGLEADFSAILRPRLFRSALQYLARKTGAPELVIERFLTDVAYYLDDKEIRTLVLKTVVDQVEKAASKHDRVVVVTHSLGSIVGYDLFDALGGQVEVPLFVTSGSPLGFPVVQQSLQPAHAAGDKRPGPARGAAPVPWLNAYDVRDFVALVHPLATSYASPVRDERTFNPSDPHSIQDYLSDPDVARPIGRVLAGKNPW